MAQRSERAATKPGTTARHLGRLVVLGGLLLGLATACALPTSGGGQSGFRADYLAPASPVVDGVSYGPRPELVFDLHLPTGGAGPFPVLVYVHSGGWIAGGRKAVPEFLLRQVTRARIALVSIDYRLVTQAADGSFVNTFPTPDMDVDRSVRFVKAHAATWNLDPHRVLLAGASAGGHLAALAAAAPGVFVDPTLPGELAAVSPRVQGVLDFVGISDFSTFAAAGGWAPSLMTGFLDCPMLQPDQCDPATVAAASVATHLDASAPPAFLAYGTHDGLVVPATQGIPLADAWARARGGRNTTAPRTSGVDFEQTDSDHNIDASTLSVRAMELWIDTTLAGRSAPSTVRLAGTATRARQ